MDGILILYITVTGVYTVGCNYEISSQNWHSLENISNPYTGPTNMASETEL